MIFDYNNLSFQMSQTTVVTAFYIIKSKFPSQQYKQWFEYFFQLDSKVICFTDEATLSFLQPPKSWHIILQPISSWKIYKHLDYFTRCEQHDWEHGHSKELYMLWCNKIYFVEEAIERNPFNSTYFAWTDIGCIRNPLVLQYAQGYPNKIPTLIEPNQVLFSLVEPHELKLSDNKKICFQHDIPLEKYKHYRHSFNAIQGGFFACSVESIREFVDKFESTLQDFITLDRFAGKDQHIFNTLVAKQQESSSFFQLLQPNSQPVDNNWFSFLYWCAKK